MTKSELNEIMNKSNFYIDSNNLYDMQILDALNAQTHTCANCAEADFSGNGARMEKNGKYISRIKNIKRFSCLNRKNELLLHLNKYFPAYSGLT